MSASFKLLQLLCNSCKWISNSHATEHALLRILSQFRVTLSLPQCCMITVTGTVASPWYCHWFRAAHQYWSFTMWLSRLTTSTLPLFGFFGLSITAVQMTVKAAWFFVCVCRSRNCNFYGDIYYGIICPTVYIATLPLCLVHPGSMMIAVGIDL